MADTEVDGAVRSIFTVGEVKVAELPAPSTALADAVSVAPSPVMVELAGQLATPDTPSAHDQAMATLALSQPAPLGLVVAVPEPVGLVLSILIGEMVAVASKPDAST